MSNQDTGVSWRLIFKCLILIKTKKGNVFLDILLRPPTLAVVFPSLFALPGERTGHVDGSPTRQCQVLLLRSIVLSVAVTRRMLRRSASSTSCEPRASRPHELSSSICGFLRPNRPDFAIQYARYFRHSHISRAIMSFDGEHEVLIVNWKIPA